MASYSFNVTDAGTGGPFSITAFRNPGTAASGGTALTIPWVENNNSGAATGVGKTQSTNQYTALMAGMRAMLGDLSVNGN